MQVFFTTVDICLRCPFLFGKSQIVPETLKRFKQIPLIYLSLISSYILHLQRNKKVPLLFQYSCFAQLECYLCPVSDRGKKLQLQRSDPIVKELQHFQQIFFPLQIYLYGYETIVDSTVQSPLLQYNLNNSFFVYHINVTSLTHGNPLMWQI